MNEYLDAAIAYLESNPPVAAVIGLVLLYLLIRKTKLLLYLLLLAGVLGVVFFLIGDLAGSGSASKKKLMNQTGTQDVK